MNSVVAIAGLVLTLSVQANDDLLRDDGPRRDLANRLDPELMQLYVSLSELPLEEQRTQMWGLSSKSRAALWKYNLDQYAQKHHELGTEERKVLRDGIRLITTPAWFDIQEGSFGYDAKQQALARHKSDAETLFLPEAIYELFIRLGPEPMESKHARPAITPGNPTVPSGVSGRTATPRVNMEACSCADYFECWYWGWGLGTWECLPSWCSHVPHCGWYGDATCTGRCKRNA